ncbi:MAG: tetratricopeptide repeat protein, partial [Myxococcales bacterium]|nr:tetratricopeptide repeat protein [Myxococcales bacterium]
MPFAAALTSLLLASGLCDGLPGAKAEAKADHARCEALCSAAPPSPECLLVARFGARALTFLEDATRSPTLDREARAAQLGLPAPELLEYLDYERLLFRRWPDVEALTGEGRAAIDAAHRDNLDNLDRVMRGALAEAMEVATRVYEARQRWLGAAHPLTAQAQSNLGHLLRAFGRLDEAQEHLLAAYVSCEVALGPDALETANRLNQLGSLALELGDLDLALARHGQALGP